MANENAAAILKTLETGIDTLATGMLAGAGSYDEWLESIERLLSTAASCNEARVADTAAALMQEFAKGAVDRGRIENAILTLQEALQGADDESRGGRPPMALAQDPELVADFIVEARDHLSTAESQLLALEQEESKPDAIHAMFRAYHTIKGLAGFLELAEIREVAHEIETLLDYARNGKLSITPDVTDAVLAGTDYLRQWLKYLEAMPDTAAPQELRDYTPHVTRLHALCPDESASQTCPSETVSERAEDVPDEANERRDESLIQPVAEHAPRGGSCAETPPNQPVAKAQEDEKHGKARAVKVDTEKLDYLVDMVGEMVIAQSLVRHDPAAQSPQLARNLAQLARITDEVQRTAMSMRMIPVGGLFQRMSRLVRDLARKSGKRAQLELAGEDVELDRNIVEELSDPLMHMIRNAMDHGIETVETRVAAGKPAVARIDLKALHMAGQIVIQVCDDGRGLDRARILEKARCKGLVAEGASPSDADIVNLIFEPGFSTAQQVSDISGRGVGMDVVRRQIQKLRGTIEVQSMAGKGTEFSLRLPLTMAIIDGLVVTVGAERFIVPIFSVKEMLRPLPEMVSTIEGSAEVVLVRNTLLPMVRLYERFGIEANVHEPSAGVLVIAEADGRQFALLVDQVLGKQEVVIKSLGRLFQDVRGVAGGAILGDGKVGLILDLQRILL